jgi:hypothetical protein
VGPATATVLLPPALPRIPGQTESFSATAVEELFHPTLSRSAHSITGRARTVSGTDGKASADRPAAWPRMAAFLRSAGECTRPTTCNPRTFARASRVAVALLFFVLGQSRRPRHDRRSWAFTQQRSDSANHFRRAWSGKVDDLRRKWLQVATGPSHRIRTVVYRHQIHSGREKVKSS